MDGIRAGGRTTVWLLSIMVPVSFVVFLLRRFGILGFISSALEPVFALLSLPGSTALAFLTGLFVNLYSAIAVMAELSLDLRETTIVALMALIAHNFLVEISVLKATGSSAIRMIALRLIAAVVGGFVLAVALPASLADRSPTLTVGVESVRPGDADSAGAVHDDEPASFTAAFVGWAIDTLLLIVRLSLILLALMVGERVLQELGAIRAIGRHLGPLMRVFGLPPSSAFLWFVSNTLGLAYGAGVLRAEVANGHLSREDGDLLNHHIAVSHSLLEDTLLFAALGVPALWIVAPRIALAMIAVWERRVELVIGRGLRGRSAATAK